MAVTRFEGIIPPVSTIFTEAGAFDPKGQTLVIEKLIAAGVDGLFICGTGGEFSQMTTAERKTVAEFAVKQAAGRAKVLIGVGSNNPREAIELTVHAEAIGADGIVAVNPSYWKVTEPRLLTYFTDIAAATKLPVLLYNIPFLTGQDLTPAFVRSVVEAAPNVLGIKETVDSIGHIREMI
ncbi:MAG: dihydrodipicolinate synthase family protein, partial [Proteobacteria bacterium]|nr:dihydrodipicolinate synthase family protein [Pseudomonadota bacterium]